MLKLKIFGEYLPDLWLTLFQFKVSVQYVQSVADLDNECTSLIRKSLSLNLYQRLETYCSSFNFYFRTLMAKKFRKLLVLHICVLSNFYCTFISVNEFITMLCT